MEHCSITVHLHDLTHIGCHAFICPSHIRVRLLEPDHLAGLTCLHLPFL